MLPSPLSVSGSIVNGGRGEKKTKQNTVITRTVSAATVRRRTLNTVDYLLVFVNKQFKI
jgi:hypothetical protein